MPLKFLHSGPKWPKGYGFEIYGNGPTYVVSVQAVSSASQAGLSPGDQLLEVDGQDVTTMAPSAIKALAKHSRMQPPALEVVACVTRLVLEPQGFSGYGFAVLNNRPVVVGSVEFGGPAFEAGLRVGDVILEVNGKRAEKVETVGSVLSQRSGQLSMLTIPVGRSGQLLHVDKGLSHLPPSDPRVHRAKDLYDKLGEVLGEDYERKMMVVAILKQYAEDRDIEILCRSLDALLHTPRSRSILRHIRTLVTPAQRPIFDDLLMTRGGGAGIGIEVMGRSPAHSYTPSVGRSTPALRPPHSLSAAGSGSIPSTHTVGTKKLVQIIRENGSFGFVVKGCSPAYIESVDPQGPADSAGLAAGDFVTKINGLDVRRCEHDRLIELLQDSGSTPTLEILRCQAGQLPVLSPAGSLTSLNTCSSQSSHASDLMPYEDHHVDSKGKTLSQHAEFLLTPKERLMLKRALQQYELNRDVVSLYGTLESVLDTPSKQTLWKFVMVTLQPPHHDYVLHRVGLPSHVLTELMGQSSSGNLAMFAPRSATSEDGEANVSRLTASQLASASTSAAASATTPSFQHHIDFLLTSTERQQFKGAIQAYQDSQDLQPLVEVMGLILDTPSKRVLWRYVLPHLTPAHQGVVRHMMDIPDTPSVSGLSLSAMDSHIGSYEENSQHVDTATNTEDDVLYGSGNNKITKEDGSSSDDENESSLGSDSASQRKAVKLKNPVSSRDDHALLQELAATRRAVEEVKQAIKGKTEDRDWYADSDDGEEGAASNMDSKHFVTIIPVGHPGFDVNRRPFYSKEMNSPEFHKLRKFVASKRGGGETETAKPPFQGLKFRDTGNDSSDSDSELVFSLQSSSYPLGEAFNHKAMVALKELDEVMAAEASSDPDSPRHQMLARDGHLTKTAPFVSFAVPPPPPPPPPPLPPVSATDGEMGASIQDWGPQMNVKRINWEKLDNKHVENTIWEQLCDTDLTEVIRYLELESQFSTKPSKTKIPKDGSGDKDKKREVCIMNSKKAYNISILLGHLKLGVREVRQAVYLMDEDTLTPELLPQLITYAPSKQEIAHYEAYAGDIDDLSKPDQFSYGMSQIYGYEERLKALLFKANFREKTEEMKENLRCIRMASNELRHSKKLARLLELILAMGNYMNQGNSRVGEAAGFRITFLTQLDITKTADSQSTFLHVLADTCYTKFPQLLAMAEDLPTLCDAAKVSSSVLNQEIQELRKGLQEISKALNKIGSHHGHTHTSPPDHFQDVMGHFISEASDEIQSVLRQQAGVMEEFNSMVAFFGEDPHIVSTEDIFNIFYDFVGKFERAHRFNMMYKRH